MSDETLTITARLVDEMTGPVAAVRTQIESLAATTAKLDAAGAAAAGGGLTKVSKSMADLDKLGKSVGSSMTDFADRIGAKLEEAAKRGAEALGLLGVAAVGFGLKTAAAMGQSRLALDTFTGSTLAGGKAFEALSKLVGPATFGQLTQGFQALSLAGASTDYDIRAMKAITNISAVQQNPGQTFDAISQAVNRIQETGQVEARSMLAFISNGVDIYGMLSKELGVPRDEVKKRLAQGANITAPTGLLSDLFASGEAGGKFGNGLEAYRATFGGQMDTIKTEASKALAVMVTPITDLVSKEGPKLTAWLTATQGRMKDMGGQLGQQLGSGNMGGFSGTLAGILGDPALAKYIDPMARSVRDFGLILKSDIVPLGKDLLAIAIPAFHVLADTLDFLAAHKGVIETSIAAFIGFEVLSKTVKVVSGLADAFSTFKMAVGDGGWMKTAYEFLARVLGLSGPAAAASGTAAAAGGPAVAAAGGGGTAAAAAGGGAMTLLGPVAIAVAGAVLLQSLTGAHEPKDMNAKSPWWSGVQSPWNKNRKGSILEGVESGKTLKSIENWLNAPTPWSAGGGKSAAPVTNNFHPGSVVVSGVSDPKVAANQVGKSVADHVEAAQKAAAERGGPAIGYFHPFTGG